MTIWQINDTQIEDIIAEYGKPAIIEHIRKLKPKARIKKVNINKDNNSNSVKKREYKPLSSSIDKKIRSAVSINTDKALEVKNAMETLNTLLAPNKKNLTLGEAKEQYFNNKANQIWA